MPLTAARAVLCLGQGPGRFTITAGGGGGGDLSCRQCRGCRGRYSVKSQVKSRDPAPPPGSRLGAGAQVSWPGFTQVSKPYLRECLDLWRLNASRDGALQLNSCAWRPAAQQDSMMRARTLGLSSLAGLERLQDVACRGIRHPNFKAQHLGSRAAPPALTKLASAHPWGDRAVLFPPSGSSLGVFAFGLGAKR